MKGVENSDRESDTKGTDAEEEEILVCLKCYTRYSLAKGTTQRVPTVAEIIPLELEQG